MGDNLVRTLVVFAVFGLVSLIGDRDIEVSGKKRWKNRAGKKRWKNRAGKKRQENGEGKEQKKTTDEQPESRTATVKSSKNNYEDSRFAQMAELCKMGDIIAMIDMAHFFKDRCTEPLRNLLDAYESEPAGENEIRLMEYLRYGGGPARAYMMWLVRAALYGNEEAQLLIDRCPYYKKKAFIPYNMLTGEGYPFIKFWGSDTLWEMGLVDMKRGYTDCSLRFDAKRGYFVFEYVSDYDPPDETGFGAEWDYENVYYNEFFCHIPTKSIDEIPKHLLILEKDREAYWQDAAHDAPGRKYRRKLCSY